MNKIVSALLALYAASFLYLEIPFVKSIPVHGLIVLAVFAILLFFVFKKVVLVNPGSGAMGMLKLVIGTVALVGVAITIVYHIAPLGSLYTIPHVLDPFFATDLALTLWLAVPLILLVF